MTNLSVNESFVTHGFPCQILDCRGSHLCGYIFVPPNHPWHGKDYDSIQASVHGGLTHAGKASGGLPCGVGEDWWCLGFDCAHYGDATYYRGVLQNVEYGETFKDASYVRTELDSLATQALAAGNPPTWPPEPVED